MQCRGRGLRHRYRLAWLPIVRLNAPKPDKQRAGALLAPVAEQIVCNAHQPLQSAGLEAFDARGRAICVIMTVHNVMSVLCETQTAQHVLLENSAAVINSGLERFCHPWQNKMPSQVFTKCKTISHRGKTQRHREHRERHAFLCVLCALLCVSV